MKTDKCNCGLCVKCLEAMGFKRLRAAPTIEDLEAWFMSIDSLTPKDDSPGGGYQMSFCHYYVTFNTLAGRKFYATLVDDEEAIVTGQGATIIEALSRLQNIIDAEYHIKYYEK